jgi:Outer membrane protein beta-barrel domain
MRTVRVTAVLAVLGSTALAGQEVRPVVERGARSVNFTFGGLGSFGLGAAGVGGGISASYFLKRDAALRVGLQVSSSRSTTPWNDPTDDGSNPGSDGSSSDFALGIGADYLRYMSAMTPRVRPYLGGGMSLTTRSSDSRPALSDLAPPGTLSETKNGAGGDGLTVGVEGVMGAEFFLYPEVSLSAEYRLNVIGITSPWDMVRSYRDRSDVRTSGPSTRTFLGFAAAGATLHIYF